MTKKITEEATVSYVNETAIARYFGHWLTDGVPQTALVEDGPYYLSNPDHWLHCCQYRDALGLRASDAD